MPTILHRLARWAETDPQAVAQRVKKDGTWHSITVREFCDRVYHLALFLESRGFTSSDTGCIFSPNCPEWVYADLAMCLLGGRSAGIYPNSIAKDVQYVLNHTEARLLSVKDRAFHEKLNDGTGPALPDRVALELVFDGDASVSPKAFSFPAALAEGARLAAEPKARKLADYLIKLDPNAPAFMIYTSGTTGNPKGALISHDNLVYTIDTAIRYWKLPMARGSLFSFLPLCHIAEKLQCVAAGISLR
jgi:long-chain acyl-CoA synthetase